MHGTQTLPAPMAADGDYNAQETMSADMALLMEKASKASEFLKALSHENRLLLLCLLNERERSVSELETLLQLRQPTISQQLARLRLDGLVSTRRDGKAIFYSIADPHVREMIGVLHKLFCTAEAC